MDNNTFPSKGYERATYISNNKIIDETNTFREKDKI